MKKSILLVMVALFAVSAHAQEDQGTKSLTFWMDGNSGHMTQSPYYEKGDEGRMFDGNCLEMGATFNHKLSNGFGYGVDMYAGSTIKFTYTDKDEPSATPTSGKVAVSYDPRARLFINYGINGFSTYAKLDTRLRLDVGASYTASFGNAGGVTVGTALCTFLIPTGYATVYEGNGKATVDEDGKAIKVNHVMISDFEVYANYAVPFAEKWAFRTQVRAIFTEGDRFGLGVQNFGQSLRVRWENRLTFNALDNVSFYGQVRYQIDGLGLDSGAKDLYKATKGYDFKADHQVFLQAGMSYKFDM